MADVNIKALFVSVDRMERGTRECSTLDELRQDYGIQVFPIEMCIRDSHGGESFGVVFDVVEQGDILLTAGLLAGQQYRGRPGDSSQRGAEVVGDGAKDIAADGLPGGLQLNGILFLVQALVQLIQGLGVQMCIRDRK